MRKGTRRLRTGDLCLSLTGIDAVPPPESSDRLQTTRGRGGRPGRLCSGVAGLAQQFLLFLSSPAADRVRSAAYRASVHGLPALQDRLDQLRAQKGEANEQGERAPGNAVTLGQLLERSVQAATSSSNHERPRAIALSSAGSHLELCFCGANPGRTNLVLAPRRVKAAVSVSSTALSLAASDADDDIRAQQKAAPQLDDDRLLIDDDLLDELAEPSFARSPGEPPSAAAIPAARLSSFRTWSLGMPAAPNRSTKLAGLVSASARILITASSISLAASRQPCGRSVPASVISAAET